MEIDKFRTYSVQLLDFSLLTYIALFLVSSAFYLASFHRNIVNTMPVLCVMTVLMLTWALRFRLVDCDSKERIRALLIQWGVVSGSGIAFTLLVILVYPIA